MFINLSIPLLNSTDVCHGYISERTIKLAHKTEALHRIAFSHSQAACGDISAIFSGFLFGGRGASPAQKARERMSAELHRESGFLDGQKYSESIADLPPKEQQGVVVVDEQEQPLSFKDVLDKFDKQLEEDFFVRVDKEQYEKVLAKDDDDPDIRVLQRKLEHHPHIQELKEKVMSAIGGKNEESTSSKSISDDGDKIEEEEDDDDGLHWNGNPLLKSTYKSMMIVDNFEESEFLRDESIHAMWIL